MTDKRNAAVRSSPVLFAFAIAAAPTILLAARLSTGISLSTDSLAYLYAAQNLFDQYSLTSVFGPNGTLLTTFPPLYPAAIAIVHLLVSSLEGSAIVVSIVCMFAASSITLALLTHLDIGRLPAGLLTLAIFVHPGMQDVFCFAWSEGLYIVISLLILLVCFRAATWNAVLTGAILGVLIGFGFLTRYAGVSLLPAAIVGVMCVIAWPIKQRVAGIGVTLLFSSAIAGFWIIRNYFADGTLLGPRAVSEDTLIFSLKNIVATYGFFLTPADRLTPFHGWIGLAGLITASTLLAAAFRWSRSLIIAAAPAFTLVVSHIVLMIYSQMNTVIDPIDARILIPALVPAIMSMAAVFHFGRLRLAGKWHRVLAGLVLAIYILVPAAMGTRWIGKEPLGFRFDGISAVDLPQSCSDGSWPTFSNKGYYLRFVGAIQNYRPLPRQVSYRRSFPRDDWPEFISALRGSRACLIWVGDEKDNAPSIEQLLGGPPENVEFDLISRINGVYIYEASYKSE